MNLAVITPANHALSVIIATNTPALMQIGEDVGKLYTDHGLPLDMSLDYLSQLSRDEKLCVIHGACAWFMQHKRNSGATEKSLERQRATNRMMLESFFKGSETGVY